MVNQNKKLQVDSLTESLKNLDNFALIGIKNVSHKNLESLRRELRKNDSSLKVIKNTFFEKAINKTAVSKNILSEIRKKFFPIKEPSAIISFGKAWDTGLKAFFQFSEKEKSVKFKLGFLDNQAYTNEEMIRIAKLPNRLELLAKIIGSMKSPMSKFVYSLKFNTNKFVYILQAKSKEVKN